MDACAHGDRWFAVCLSDDRLEATATRLGLEVVPGSRTLPGGSRVSWRGAGIEDPGRDPWLPFFIGWDGPPELHPGRRNGVVHPSGADGIARVEVAGEPERLDEWLDGAEVPIDVAGGEPGVRAVVLHTAGGDEVVG